VSTAPTRLDPRPTTRERTRLVVGAGRPTVRREPGQPVLLRAALVVAALGFVACYLAVAFARFRYPFQLEWMEGGVLEHVQRVLHGQALYVAPSIHFTPFLYTPLYYYVGAGAAWLFGLHLSTLRLVSIVASIVAFAAVYRLVWIETRDRWASLAAVGLLAACFQVSGAWLDLARVDSLFLASLLVGLVLVRQATTRRAVLLAGLVLAASYFTKQSALLPMAAVVPFLWRRGRPLALVYLATVGGVLGGATLWLDHSTGGWFGQYTLHLAGQHAIATSEYVGFFTHDLLGPVGVGLVVGAIGLLAYRRGDSGRFWLPVTAGLLLASYTARLHTGGYSNVLLPAYAGVAVALGLGLHALTRPEVLARHRGAVRLALLATLVMFCTLIYNPFRQVPPASATRAGNALVAELAHLPGPVYVPSQSWLLPRARSGASPTAHPAAMGDILRAHLDGTNHSLARQLQDTIASQAFGSVVVDAPAMYDDLPKDFPAFYCKAATLPRADRLEPLTGTRTAPATVWIPRTASAPCRDQGLAAPLLTW
jgi:4-amino-4-deoxy-L-arabinose transferase-like glycosyltransferase